jgi:hypothetical protein
VKVNDARRQKENALRLMLHLPDDRSCYAQESNAPINWVRTEEPTARLLVNDRYVRNSPMQRRLRCVQLT